MTDFNPKEYKVTALRDCPVPEAMQICETPDHAVAYWKMHIATHPYFNPECECLVVLFLNVRKRVKGHQLVTIGTVDTLLVQIGMLFRTAIVISASCIAVMHNHPSGEPSPSEADIKVTRDLIRAGQLLKIEVIDHVIIGSGTPGFASLRALGYFYS
jgi:DNA repair protein RadC